MIRLLLFVTILIISALAPIAADAACWCHPFYPTACSDNWQVLQGGALGFTLVAQGAPPVPEAFLELALIPPLCSDYACQYTLVNAGRACLFVSPAVFGLPPLSPERKAALMPFMLELQQRILLVRGHLQILGPASMQYRGYVSLLISFTVAMSNVAKAVADGPNPDYAAFPALEAFVLPAPVTADVTLTAGQASALNAWAAKLAKGNNTFDQANRTLDSLSGAVQAAQAGDVAAIPWARRLARAVDALMAQVATLGQKETTARAAVAAAFPPVALAATCASPPDVTQAITDLLLAGVAVYPATLAGIQLRGACAPAATWPARVAGPAMTAADAAWYAGLVPYGHAQTVCAATGYCSSLTTTTMTPLAPVVGKIKQQVTVTATGPYPIPDGVLVTVSAPGFPTQMLPLVGGGVVYKQAAPSGSVVAVTATFSEQKNAKLGASATTVTVVVP